MSAGWNTIESDAGVFTFLASALGAKHIQLEELVSLDVEILKSLSPVHGVIFLFKYPTQLKDEAGKPDGELDYAAQERIFFAKQTIQNACGTQALLSVLLNQGPDVDIGQHLKDFRAFTTSFPPELRGEVLSNSELIRDAHNSFARASPFISEEQRVATQDDDVYHFIAYTTIDNILYELDGLKQAPISHGQCSDDEFPAKIIPILSRRIQRYPAAEIRFNLLAVVADQLLRGHVLNDSEVIYREREKRNVWQRENALRRHNFTSLIGHLMGQVTAAKLKEGDQAYTAWIEEAKLRTRLRHGEKS